MSRFISGRQELKCSSSIQPRADDFAASIVPTQVDTQLLKSQNEERTNSTPCNLIEEKERELELEGETARSRNNRTTAAACKREHQTNKT